MIDKSRERERDVFDRGLQNFVGGERVVEIFRPVHGERGEGKWCREQRQEAGKKLVG